MAPTATTPSGSRASSSSLAAPPPPLAKSLSNGKQIAPSTTTPTSSHSDAQPGCDHLAALSHSDLKQLLRRYSVGIRWGKRVRRGLVQSEQDQEQDEWDAEHAAYHGGGEQNGDIGGKDGHDGKRRKLLSHPACSDCSATLHKPYLCLDCAFIGCPTSPRPHSRRPITKSCIAKHLHASSHTFAFAIHSGHLYCSACAAGIHDPRFDALYHREKSRTQGRACGPLLDDVERYSHLPRQPISTRVPRGIHNLGATCFLSVILQSFLHNPLLRNYFLADRHNSDLCYKASPSDSCMACEVDAMFRDFFLHDVDKSTHPHDPWIPNSFLYAVWKTQESSELSQSGQQDSHELYISALNTLHTALTAPGRHPASRKPEIPQWPNENAGKGMDESKIREVEQGYGVYHTGSGDGTPEFASKLCDCIIHRTFSGVLQSDVRCLVCGYRSSTHDPVLDLSVDLRPPSLIAQQERELQALLDIEDGGAGLSADGKPKKKKQKKHGDGGGGGGTTTPAAAAATATSSAGSPAPTVPTSTSSGTFAKNRFTEHESQDLVECLRRYCSSEQLPSSSYSCPQCGPVEASKQLSLCRLPPVLAIQLKRFEHTPTSSYKIETRVRFPQRLDVHEFVTPSVLERGAAGRDVQESLAYDDFVYDLFCVIVHEGTLNTGHYWCFCKWQGEWYKMNDTEARPAKVSEVFDNAYQLVYVRTSLENVVSA